jgi:thiamine-phosphate pyrophosphorylase
MKLAEVAKRLNSANAPGLPPLVMVTDAARQGDIPSAAARLPAGSAIILRDYELVERGVLAAALARIARQHGLMLLIAGDPALALAVGAAGIHLPEARVNEARGWRHRRNWLITAAAHSRAALQRAALAGADAALLSPVFATASHPGAPALGVTGFNLLAEAAPLPVYALGGISETNARRLLGGKAAGIAAIGALARGI